ncbi:MAG: CoA ester lyase [Rhodospirillaceae bacterium]|nr:CoA ester lyase [Rhodospirillaceae bacterium]
MTGRDTTMAERWRSVLFLSPLSEKHLAKAPSLGADGIMLDLEDAIRPEDKPAARARLPEAVAGLRAGGITDVLVRVNAPWLLAFEDIRAAVSAGVDYVTLPKVETPGRVAVIGELLDELEAGDAPRTRLLLQIESALGLEALPAILRASPRVSAVMLGPEDFALDMGAMPTIAANEWANVQVLAAARAAGVTPLGFPGSIAMIDDFPTFRTQIERAKELGFRGAAVIHPKQVAIVNEVFAPTAEELAAARRIVDAAATAEAGAFLLDGKMIDPPIVVRAQTLLNRGRT